MTQHGDGGTGVHIPGDGTGGIIDVTPIVPASDDAIPYIGRVVSSHGTYSYLRDIRRGFETVHGGDVFVPQTFEVGTLVEFNVLHPDRKRPGNFRTEEARPLTGAMIRVAGSELSREVFLSQLAARTDYHALAKEKSPEDVERALANGPFEEMLGIVAVATKFSEQDITTAMARHATRFLQTTYAGLAPLDFSTSVTEMPDEQEEQRRLDEFIAQCREIGMEGQAQELPGLYAGFKGVRQVFRYLADRNMLRPDSVLPAKHLAELTVMAPVWYCWSKELDQQIDESAVDDPEPSALVRTVADMVGTRQYAWLAQIYNRRYRPMFLYRGGRDIMPPDVVKMVADAKKTFDFLIVATPYHDQASKEWQDDTWLRSIDPFLLGIRKDLPYVFVLGRWSGTGIFPLMGEMIADTIDHLRTHKNLLGRFTATTYWYKGASETPYSNCLGGFVPGPTSQSSYLPSFADEIIRRYERNELFPWLRGELGEYHPFEKLTNPTK